MAGTMARMKTGIMALALSVGVAAAGGVAVAQEATPGSSPPAPTGATPPPVTQVYPVALHQGSCPAPEAEPVVDPRDAQVFGSTAEEPQQVGTSQFPPALTAQLVFELGIQDVTSVPHAIAVHQSPEEFGTVIACGDIAGIVAEGVLIVPIRPVNQGTVAGTATIQEEEGNITITASLVPEVMAANQ